MCTCIHQYFQHKHFLLVTPILTPYETLHFCVCTLSCEVVFCWEQNKCLYSFSCDGFQTNPASCKVVTESFCVALLSIKQLLNTLGMSSHVHIFHKMWEGVGIIFFLKSFLGGVVDVMRGLRWLIIRNGPNTSVATLNFTRSNMVLTFLSWPRSRFKSQHVYSWLLAPVIISLCVCAWERFLHQKQHK